MKIFTASTHDSEYLIHKYWARKPANVVREFIKKYAIPDSYVLDPFCGSSVVNIESLKLGIDSIGIDINPVAVLIGEVLLRDVSLGELEKTYSDFQEKIAEKLKSAYSLGRVQIRHCTHIIVLRCKECGFVQEVNGSLCQKCGKRINANIGTLHSTRVISVTDSSGKEYKDKAILEEQTAKSQRADTRFLKSDINKYDQNFLTNKRILSYEGTSTRSFYTKRAFLTLAVMADFIHSIPSNLVRNFFLLTLTATSTQASRLIPSRNGLTTGGPAWSVPGFWIAKKHLEVNPVATFDVRFKKSLAAICSLKRKSFNSQAKSQILNGNCSDVLKKLQYKINGKIGYVFTDPPYGDSVPYLEVSAIWNSWLKAPAFYADEIVVSDSPDRNKRWERYKLDIIRAINTTADVLKENGYFTVTFNQLSLDAWHTLIYGFENAKLQYRDVSLVLPAVVPSKARFAMSGSYLGDYYLTFQKSNNFSERLTNRKLFEKQLIAAYVQAAAKREGRLNYPHIIRIAVALILKNGYISEATNWAKEIIGVNFLKRKESYYLLKVDNPSSSIDSEIDNAIAKVRAKGKKVSWDIISGIYDGYDFLEAPEISEIINRLKISSKQCKKQSQESELLFK